MKSGTISSVVVWVWMKMVKFGCTTQSRIVVAPETLSWLARSFHFENDNQWCSLSLGSNTTRRATEFQGRPPIPPGWVLLETICRFVRMGQWNAEKMRKRLATWHFVHDMWAAGLINGSRSFETSLSDVRQLFYRHPGNFFHTLCYWAKLYIHDSKLELVSLVCVISDFVWVNGVLIIVTCNWWLILLSWTLLNK